MSDCFDHGADAYDRFLNGEEDDPENAELFPRSQRRVYGIVADAPKKLVRCNRCGDGGLTWQVRRGRNTLVDAKDLPHVCETTRYGVNRPSLYAVVDRLTLGELKELIGYCEQLKRTKKENGHDS